MHKNLILSINDTEYAYSQDQNISKLSYTDSSFWLNPNEEIVSIEQTQDVYNLRIKGYYDIICLDDTQLYALSLLLRVKYPVGVKYLKEVEL